MTNVLSAVAPLLTNTLVQEAKGLLRYSSHFDRVNRRCHVRISLQFYLYYSKDMPLKARIRVSVRNRHCRSARGLTYGRQSKSPLGHCDRAASCRSWKNVDGLFSHRGLLLFEQFYQVGQGDVRPAEVHSLPSLVLSDLPLSGKLLTLLTAFAKTAWSWLLTASSAKTSLSGLTASTKTALSRLLTASSSKIVGDGRLSGRTGGWLCLRRLRPGRNGSGQQ